MHVPMYAVARKVTLSLHASSKQTISCNDLWCLWDACACPWTVGVARTSKQAALSLPSVHLWGSRGIGAKHVLLSDFMWPR